MDESSDIKEFLASLNKRKHERFTKAKGYVFDKVIFRFMFTLILILFLVSWGLSGFTNPLENKISLSCAEGFHMCENPLYKNYQYRGSAGVQDYVIDELEFLPPGFSINPVPWYIKYFGHALFLIIVITFIINHLVHNKGYKIKQKLSEAINMEESIIGYCMRCREKRTIKDPVIENKKTRRGIKRTAHGTCSSCGVKVYVTLKKEA
jgi:hypothetical protein